MRVGVYNTKTKAILVDRFSDEEFFAKCAKENPHRIYFLPECWENFIEGIRYKPWWFFEYRYDIDYNSELLHVQMRVPDRDDPTKNIYVGQTFILGPWETQEYANLFIKNCIIDLEIHEVCENLLIDGVRVFDPHKEEVTQ